MIYAENLKNIQVHQKSNLHIFKGQFGKGLTKCMTIQSKSVYRFLSLKEEIGSLKVEGVDRLERKENRRLY